MQFESANFTLAASGAGRVRTDQLMVDWGADGAGLREIVDYFDRYEQVSDNFTRSASSGFGTATTGQVWSHPDSILANFLVDGAEAGITLTSANSRRFAVLDADVFDGCVRAGKLVIAGGVVATGSSITSGVMLRFRNTSNFYVAHLIYNTDDSTQLQIAKVVGGNFTSLVLSSSLGLSGAGTAFAIAFEVHGTTLRAKAWNRSSAEPAAWNVTVEDDDESLIVPGKAGITANRNTGNTNTNPAFAFDDFTVENSWDESDTGERWTLAGTGDTVTAEDVVITSAGGVIELRAAPAVRIAYLTTTDTDLCDVDMTVNWSCAAPSGAAIEPLGFTARMVDDENFLMGRLSIAVGGIITNDATAVVAGVEELRDSTVLGVAHSAGATYTSRMQLFGTQLRMRTWLVSDVEPNEWDLAAGFAGSPTTGGLGIRAALVTGNLNAKPVVVTYTGFQVVNGALDDMSARLGAWSVDHHLDDGLPDTVSFVAGTAVPTLRAEIIRPGHVSGRDRYTNRQFFSPYNVDSPIYGVERDVPPVALEVGFITEGGPERIPVFTGQAQDFTINGQHVTMPAISAARLKLAKLVHPPAVYGFYEGANATWLVSYALAACGVYASPPPQEGCRLWAPMHGSVHPFIPATNNPQINMGLYVPDPDGVSDSGGQYVVDAPWIDGPYVSAPDLYHVDGVNASIDIVPTGSGVALEAGTSLVAQDGAIGKVEMWVKGDAATDDTPSLARMILSNTNGSGVDCIIPPGTRRPAIIIDDNTTTNQFIHSQALPTDGEWHFIGFAWRIAGASSKRWITIDDDEESDTATSFLISGLPTTEDFADDNPRLIARIPIAEVHMTAGERAVPDQFPWLKDIPFTPGAQIVRSSVNFTSIAERAPREAWEIVSSMALAELAMLRIDESDVVRYLGWRHWGQAAQQTIVDVLDTRRNMGMPNVNIDPTKIINAVSATFSEGFNIDLFTSGGALFDVLTLPPGLTILVLPTDSNIVELRGYSFDYIEAADTVAPTNTNFVSINLASDGSGAYGTASDVAVSVLSWNPGEVVIQFDNTSGTTWYTANDLSFATVNVAGKLLDLKTRTVTEADADSIAVRGERGLPVSLTTLQRSIDARRTARRIVNDLSVGVPTIGEVAVRGHPGRQPGDLVTVVDVEANVNNRFRLQSIHHNDDGELYTQRVTARRARQGGSWGVDAYWGETIWTTED